MVSWYLTGQLASWAITKNCYWVNLKKVWFGVSRVWLVSLCRNMPFLQGRMDRFYLICHLECIITRQAFKHDPIECWKNFQSMCGCWYFSTPPVTSSVQWDGDGHVRSTPNAINFLISEISSFIKSINIYKMGYAFQMLDCPENQFEISRIKHANEITIVRSLCLSYPTVTTNYT